MVFPYFWFSWRFGVCDYFFGFILFFGDWCFWQFVFGGVFDVFCFGRRVLVFGGFVLFLLGLEIGCFGFLFCVVQFVGGCVLVHFSCVVWLCVLVMFSCFWLFCGLVA